MNLRKRKRQPRKRPNQKLKSRPRRRPPRKKLIKKPPKPRKLKKRLLRRRQKKPTLSKTVHTLFFKFVWDPISRERFKITSSH